MKNTIIYYLRLVLLVCVMLALLLVMGCKTNSTPAPTPTASSIVPASTITSVPITTATSIPATSSSPVSTPPITQPPTSPVISSTIPSQYSIHIASKANAGNYLTDPRGRTLYYTTSDRPGYSNLPDETLGNWPVFYVADIVVPPSLNAADFGTYTRDNKAKQTTFRGYPLYYFVQDIKAGDTFGNKLAGVWFVLDPGNFQP
jgi:predicted lipoprotein with Yx(FWY)xxD motif